MHRILIINDTPIVNKVLKKAIEPGGFDVDAVELGQEGVEFARSGEYDLILLDYQLPDINGDVVCTTLKADDGTKDVPIYYISSMEKEKMDQVIEDTGAQGYLDITMNSDELVRKMNELIGSPGGNSIEGCS